MDELLKVPLVLHPQPEGGYTVTSPLLPELITEGDTAQEAVGNVADALAATIELYEEMGRSLPDALRQPANDSPIWFEALVPAQ